MDFGSWRTEYSERGPPASRPSQARAWPDMQNGRPNIPAGSRFSYDRRPASLNHREQTPHINAQEVVGHKSSTLPDQANQSLHKPLDEPNAKKAVLEGRRIYVGNMPYDAQPTDVHGLFQEVEGNKEINMSVDPITGRNPSYCFVDFDSREIAQKVMRDFKGRIFQDRVLKLGPGVAPRQGPRPPANDRWKRVEDPEQYSASADKEGRRLFVGGLPRFKHQAETDSELRHIFKEFEVDYVSKLVSPVEFDIGTQKSGHPHYCFVDFKTESDAIQAQYSMHGASYRDGYLKVDFASGKSSKLGERRRIIVSNLPNFDNDATTTAKMHDLFENFELKDISKLYTGHKDEDRWNGEELQENHYCFVELNKPDETHAAIEALDQINKWDRRISVKKAFGNAKLFERPVKTGWGPKAILEPERRVASKDWVSRRHSRSASDVSRVESIVAERSWRRCE